MKTWPLRNEETGKVFGLEIPNVYSLGAIATILAQIDCVSVKWESRSAAFGEEPRLPFLFNGNEWMVLEPFGDTSRLWIVPDDPDPQLEADAKTLLDAFSSHKPYFFQQLIGG